MIHHAASVFCVDASCMGAGAAATNKSSCVGVGLIGHDLDRWGHALLGQFPWEGQI